MALNFSRLVLFWSGMAENFRVFAAGVPGEDFSAESGDLEQEAGNRARAQRPRVWRKMRCFIS